MKSTIQCVGIIMDGNRRFAKEKGLPSLEGHKKGNKTLEKMIEWVKECDIPHLIVYAFSTENWSRSKKEVAYLMSLFRIALSEWGKKAEKEKIRLRFIGDREKFDKDMQEAMDDLEKKTEKFTVITVTIALSYGGRTEIIHAVNKILSSGIKKITEQNLENNLWTNGIPDPDIIIRTGGERRLSNFLIWQSVYSELFFTNTYWPTFSKKEFYSIIEEFVSRQRRFGK